MLAARRKGRLVDLAVELDRATVVECDVTSDADRERLIEQALHVTGRLDLFVNNAGISLAGPAAEQSTDDFRRTIEVNLTSVFVLCKLAAAHMVEQGGGTIINVASMLGVVAATPVSDAAYAASKAGVINLTRELAAQWGREGVRVNALAPGWFPTEMSARLFGDERSMRWLRRNTMVGRAGQLEELDAALLLLAASSNSYMTGHVLLVDGGWTAR